VLTVCAAAALTLVSIPAWAHVEVETNRAEAGAKDVTLTFHVPNEQAQATTTGITFIFPADHPLLGVTTTAQNGFTPTLSMVPLATAVQGPKGQVHEVVRSVLFTGGRLAGSEEKTFAFHVDQLPMDAHTLTFKALQKYSTGATVSWIEVAADGAAEPEHPAPVLVLGQGQVAAHPAMASHPVAVTAAAKAGSGASATGLGTGTPLAVAAGGGLAVAAGGWVLWRRRRGLAGSS
jgi:LPXTG-motif cell wall-anchored protein